MPKLSRFGRGRRRAHGPTDHLALAQQFLTTFARQAAARKLSAMDVLANEIVHAEAARKDVKLRQGPTPSKTFGYTQ